MLISKTHISLKRTTLEHSIHLVLILSLTLSFHFIIIYRDIFCAKQDVKAAVSPVIIF